MDEKQFASFINSSKRTFEEYAKESLDIQYINGTLYAFGSELAVLRLFYTYRYLWKANKAGFGYSQTYTSYYFRLET